MRLAPDDITLKVGAERVHLRPTLRAAMRLERRHNGFQAILAAILAENMGVMADVIREGADRPSALPDLLAALGAKPLRTGLEALTGPLLDFTLALAGVEEETQAEGQGEPASTSRITFADYHAKLFRLATGWLGWTPSDAWNATPAEIMEAYAGRLEMLGAIFGGGKGEGEALAGPDFTRDEGGWTAFKAFTAGGGNVAR